MSAALQSVTARLAAERRDGARVGPRRITDHRSEAAVRQGRTTVIEEDFGKLQFPVKEVLRRCGVDRRGAPLLLERCGELRPAAAKRGAERRPRARRHFGHTRRPEPWRAPRVRARAPLGKRSFAAGQSFYRALLGANDVRAVVGGLAYRDARVNRRGEARTEIVDLEER